MTDNTVPVIGRLAVIKQGSVTIGSTTDMSCDITADLIKEYTMSGQTPALLAQGNQTFKVACSKLFIDGVYASLILAGTPVTVIIYPTGTTPTGHTIYTIGNVVFSKYTFKATQKGAVLEDVAGEGNTFTVGTA
jgi:hypothetical protein